MARVSAEDCLLRLPNRFALCMLAAKRARELASGRPPLVECDNKFAVTSLREIAAGKVTSHESLKEVLSAHTAQMAGARGPARPAARPGPFPSSVDAQRLRRGH